LLAHGRWFSPDTPASSTTKTGRHDIAELLLKVALSTINQIKSYHLYDRKKLWSYFDIGLLLTSSLELSPLDIY
jgi:lactate dehydrogenase-like 2-hydroxyacid dehydrogenase